MTYEDIEKLIVHSITVVLILDFIIALVCWIKSYKWQSVNEKDAASLTHVFLIFVLFIIVFSHFYNKNIDYITPYFTLLLPVAVPALTLMFIWHDNRKRDNQHLESINRMDKTAEIMINIEKRDNIKRNIIAAANSIYSYRDSDLDYGIKIIQGKDIASNDFNFTVTWNILYQNELDKGDSYRFQIRIMYLPDELFDLLFDSVDAMDFDDDVMSAVIKAMENEKSPSYYELSVKRHEGHYGEVFNGGIGNLSTSVEGYQHLSSILGIIQSLDEDELTSCHTIIDNHRAQFNRFRK